MNLRKLIFTENACYKAGRKITPKGIMVHSTGANNPNLRRYVGPDDGLLGVNQYNNHWNQDRPDGRQVCVHAFIGKLKDGSIATYQTLPWNHRGWHAGGDANNTHIGFEICEDGLTDASYFNAVYKEAVELCAYLCKEYKLDPMATDTIIGHYEGYQRGIASNHADPRHWFSRHGKSMDTFRTEVKKLLTANETPAGGSDNTTYPEKLTTGYYRVRKTWADAKSQLGAYRILSNAKAQVDKNPGYYVFNNDGIIVYPTSNTSSPTYKEYTVVKGDSLWAIAAKLLGSGTRYIEIVKLNNLKSTIIYTGQKLKIPN